MLTFISVFCIFINCKEKQAEQKPEIKPRYVSANGGANMRDKPDVSGEKIVTLPHGEKVGFLEETGSDAAISGKIAVFPAMSMGYRNVYFKKYILLLSLAQGHKNQLGSV